QDEQRLARRDAEAAALANRVVAVAAVATEHSSAAIDDLSLFVARGGVPGEELTPARARHEAQVLALLPFGHGKRRLSREPPDRGLAHLAEWEPDALQRTGIEGGQHVGLILGGIEATGEERALGLANDSRVVTGHQRLRAEPVGCLEHCVEADEAVAAHARIRCAPAIVLSQEVGDDRVAEAFP